MNRNTRMMVYLFFAVAVVAVMIDCSRRMQHKRVHAQGTHSESQPGSAASP